MAEELKDGELDEIAGGLLGIDEKKIFELWKSKIKERIIDHNQYIKAARKAVKLINSGVGLDDLFDKDDN